MTGSLRVLFFVGDILFLNISVVLSLFFTASGEVDNIWISNIYLIVLSNLAWLFLVLVSSPYNVNKGWTLSKTARSQIAFVFILLLVIVALVFFFRQRYSYFQIALIYLLFIPVFFAFRIISFYFRKVFTDAVPYRNYVLIGRNDLSEDVRKYFLMNPEEGYKFQGYIEFRSGGFDLDQIRQVCVEREVHEIYCCLPGLGNEALRDLIDFGLDSLIKVKVISKSSSHALKLDQFDQLPGIDSVMVALDEKKNQVIKRTFDIIFSVAFHLLISWWLFPIIAIAIKIDSPGPVFFVQLRSGRGNQPFKCMKFRTMVVNAQSDTLQASRTDSRITKLGHFLRKTSIDELPQFINVLNGSMSVVGPRPHMLKHTESYSKLIDRFMGRHYVKPGVTGLAQCLGYRGETRDLVDMENRVRMDRYYIEHWTFWFDIKIILLTVVSLIRGSDKAF
jgi:putative colanic acid biosysnthesis UDP-glucose lipid carrier transferase